MPTVLVDSSLRLGWPIGTHPSLAAWQKVDEGLLVTCSLAREKY